MVCRGEFQTIQLQVVVPYQTDQESFLLALTMELINGKYAPALVELRVKYSTGQTNVLFSLL